MLNLIMPIGVVVVLLFLAKRFVRSRDSLQSYQTKRMRHNEGLLASIHDDVKMFSSEEAMQPVVAGVRELVALNDLHGCVLDDRGSSLHVETPTLQFDVSWVLRTTQLASAKLAGQGGRIRRGHWEVLVFNEPLPASVIPGHVHHSEEPETIQELALLMARIESLLCPDEEPA